MLIISLKKQEYIRFVHAETGIELGRISNFSKELKRIRLGIDLPSSIRVLRNDIEFKPEISQSN